MNESPRIFIVDDDVDIIATFKEGLEEWGFEVDGYNNPVTSLREFKANFYDLLIIDVRMPVLDGFELAERILRIDRTSKICFITAFDIYYKSLVAEYPNLDFTCFIKKPITIEALRRHMMTELNNGSRP